MPRSNRDLAQNEAYIERKLHSSQFKLVDQWERIHQENKSALVYVTEFDELNKACGLRGDPHLTLSKFRIGLRKAIWGKIILSDVKTLK